MPLTTVLYVCASATAFWRHHLPLAVATTKTMHTHAVLVDDSSEAMEAIAAQGINIHRIALNRKSKNPFRIIHEALTLRKIIRKVEPGIIVPINLKSVFAAALASRNIPVSFLGAITGLGYLYTENSPMQVILRRLTECALRSALSGKQHMLMFSNDDDRDEYVTRQVVAAENACVVPIPGVSMELYRYVPEPEKGFRVILPARMLWDKGVGDFVAAARRLRNEIPECECWLIGSTDPGNPTGIPDKQLQEWSDSGEIVWKGHCDNMAELMAISHVVCLPTRYREGFPRVLAEAMACGRAFIATDVPGCRDAFASGGGISVPVGNVDALASGIASLYRQPEDRKERGKAGRAWAQRHLTEEIITLRVLSMLSNLQPAKTAR